MAIGPFSTYAPPGVYTSTTTDLVASGALTGLRIPVFIGTGAEVQSVTGMEVVRGSSGGMDTLVTGEDTTGRWVVSGTKQNPVLGNNSSANLSMIKVRNYPITDSLGNGTPTYDPSQVTVTVDGTPIPVLAVDGPLGIVTVAAGSAPVGSFVLVSYYFDRTDTVVQNDLSNQVTDGAAVLTSANSGNFDILTDYNVLKISVNDSAIVYSISLTVGTGKTVSNLISEINAVGIVGLTASSYLDVRGDEHLRLTSDNNLAIGNGSVNGILGFANGQKTYRTKTFFVANRPIVDGSNNGSITTDPNKVAAKVNGALVTVSMVDGTNGAVTLAKAPADGDTVTIQYYYNTWVDSFDYLPNSNVVQITRVGNSPGDSSYLQGQDFVLVNSGAQSRIYWGRTFTVGTGENLGGTEFGTSQISALMVDNKIYGEELSAVGATLSIFSLSMTPTSGNARDSVIPISEYDSIINGRNGLPTTNPTFVTAYVGSSFGDAFAKGPVKILKVDPVAKTITLQKAAKETEKVYADYYVSNVVRDTITATVVNADISGTGTYALSSLNDGTIYNVSLGTNTVPETLVWPTGNALNTGAYINGGSPVSETYSIQIDNSRFPARAASVLTGVGPFDLTNLTKNFGVVTINGTDCVVDLSQSYEAFLISASMPDVDFFANETITISVNGISHDIDLNGCEGMSDVATAIDTAAIGVDASAYYASNGTGFIVVHKSSGSIEIKKVITAGKTDVTAKAGFTIGTQASSSTDALNKPAVLTSNVIVGGTTISTNNNTLEISVDGGDFSLITITTSPSATATTIAAQINAVFNPDIASVSGGNKLVLTSSTKGKNSSIKVVGKAVSVLFGDTTQATGVNVTAEALASALNNTFVGSYDAVARVVGSGLNIVEIATIDTGADQELSFSTDQSSTAFRTDTGLQIDDTTGDVGEDEISGFSVVGTVNNVEEFGEVGRTFTHSKSGLTFTLMPSQSGTYTNGSSFNLQVSDIIKTNATIPCYAIGGLELLVTNTNNTTPGSSAIVNTYTGSGNEPSIGEAYYASYSYDKADFSTKLYGSMKEVTANFGSASTKNPLSLAAYFAFLNGAQTVALKQVRKIAGQDVADPSSYIAAIDDLRKPIGGSVKPDIIVPLTTDPVIAQYLREHCSIMSSPRMESERTSIVGTAVGTSPAGVQKIAKSLNSDLMTVVYPDAFQCSIQDSLTGLTTTTLVDGSYMAAALAATTCNPAYDVASPMTRRTVAGFTAIGRILEPTEANQVAVAGVTVIEQSDASIRVRHGLTTKVDNVITRTPSVTLTVHHVQKRLRAILDPFIGVKLTAGVPASITAEINKEFQNLINAQIVGQVAGVTVSVDANDPTIVRMEAIYVPVFPLEYIVSSLSIRVRI